MRTRILTIATVAAWALAGAANADFGGHRPREVLYDTMYIVDTQSYDGGIPDCIGGWAIFGVDYDMQACDDFVIPSGASYKITSLTMGYACYLNQGEANAALVEFFADDDADGRPDEVPIYSAVINPGAIAVTHFGDVFDLFGETWYVDFGDDGPRLEGKGRGTTYWVAMQPITCWGNDDWYYILRDYDVLNGTQPFERDPGAPPPYDVPHDGSLGFGPFPGLNGVSDWANVWGPGDVAMRIEGELCGEEVEWTDRVLISADLADGQDPRIAARHNYVHVVWRDDSDGTLSVMYRRSIDGGETWDPNSLTLWSASTYLAPHIAVSGEYVHVVWSELEKLWYCRSDDDGKTWMDPVCLANDVMFVPDVAVFRDKVYVVWTSAENVFDVQFRRSLDNGATWDDPLLITENTGFLPADLIADSWLDQYTGNVPQGSKTYMGVRNIGSGGYESWSILRFDLSSIPPGTSIASAKLHLYFYDHMDNYPVGPLAAYRVTADWNESTVTWANKPGHDATATGAASVPASYGWMEWDVQADVQDFIDGVENNYGWIIKDEYYWPYGGIPFSFFRTREYGQFEPYLEIEANPEIPHYPRVAGYSDHVYTTWYTEGSPSQNACFTRSTGSGAPGTWAATTTLWSNLYWPNRVSIAAFWNNVYVDHSAFVGDPPQGPAQKVSTNWGATFSNTQWLGNGNDGYPYPEVDASRAYTGNGCTSYLREYSYGNWDLFCSTAPAGEDPIDSVEGVSCSTDIAAVNYGTMHVVCSHRYDDDPITYGVYYYRWENNPCPADVNSNNTVDINDLFAVLAAWGPCDDCPEDINEDGWVDIDDVFEVLAGWGPCP